MVMRKAMLLAFLFVVAFTHAQFSINGKVTDNEGNPLPGANLLLKPLNLLAICRSFYCWILLKEGWDLEQRN